MRMVITFFVVMFGLTALSHATVCTPSFETEPHARFGWQGADGAYSIPLPDGRDIWIFGDTLYGKKRIVRGNEPRMVHNSLAVSTCGADGRWKLNYFLKQDASNKPVSYFTPADPHHWYWAMDGFELHGELWITLLCIEATGAKVPGAMGFRTCGSDLAHITHLERDPQHWKKRIQPLVRDGVNAYPSATTVVYGDFAYLFAVYESGKHPLVVTRIALNKLSDAAGNLEYLAANGSWNRGLLPADAMEIMAQGRTELSIRYHPDRKEWVAIMFDPERFSNKILMKTASGLTGPWTKGTVIFQTPEMSARPARDKNVFCYAGKEHPELERGNQLLFTYVCNTMHVPSLVKNKQIYIPQIVSLPLPHRY